MSNCPSWLHSHHVISHFYPLALQGEGDAKAEGGGPDVKVKKKKTQARHI